MPLALDRKVQRMLSHSGMPTTATDVTCSICVQFQTHMHNVLCMSIAAEVGVSLASEDLCKEDFQG